MQELINAGNKKHRPMVVATAQVEYALEFLWVVREVWNVVQIIYAILGLVLGFIYCSIRDRKIGRMRTFLEEIVLWARKDQREGFWVCPRKTGCPKHGKFDNCQWNHWGGIQSSDKPMYSMSFIWAVTSTSSSWLVEVVPQEAKNDIGSWIVEFASCLLYWSYWSVPISKNRISMYLPSQNRKRRWFGSPAAHGCPKWAWAVGITGAKHLGIDSALWSPGRKTRDGPPTFKHGWNPLVFFRLGGALVSNRAFCFASSNYPLFHRHEACWNIGSKMM